MVFASASGRARNLSAQTGDSAATTARSDCSFAILSAVLPSDQPPQLKPTNIVATAPAAAPCSKRFSDSPCRIEGTCMVFPFTRHVSERGHGDPAGSRLAELNAFMGSMRSFANGICIKLITRPQPETRHDQKARF